jgi:3'-phosphoadenosine 5'-phosphosulfate sulfotransferase (PAPS reductase)/FAD synthetase
VASVVSLLLQTCVTRFVTRVAQRVPQVLILPTFHIREVTRFVTRVAQRVPLVLILPYKPGDVTNEESRKGKHMWHPLCHSCYKPGDVTNEESRKDKHM